MDQPRDPQFHNDCITEILGVIGRYNLHPAEQFIVCESLLTTLLCKHVDQENEHRIGEVVALVASSAVDRWSAFQKGEGYHDQGIL